MKFRAYYLLIILLLFATIFLINYSLKSSENTSEAFQSIKTQETTLQSGNNSTINVEETENYLFQTWSFIASNDPADYLGDIMGVESPSNWKEYAPLLTKVEEITKGLNSDREKALAIANWVMKSREYEQSATSIANKYGTIIDIFNAEKGVCLDAAYLTTAMMRLSNIPARAVAPATGIMHEYTEVFVEGEWESLDATFYSGPTEGLSFFVSDKNNPSSLLFIHEYIGYDKKDDTFVLLVKSIAKEGYGTVRRPIISEQRLDKWYKSWPKEEGSFANPLFYCVLRFKGDVDWQAMGSSDFQKKGVGFNVDENYRDMNYRDMNLPYESTDGWMIEALPPGKYKFDCSISPVLDQKYPPQTAYAEFSIKSNTQTTIIADMFKKIPGAPEEEFNALIGLLNESITV